MKIELRDQTGRLFSIESKDVHALVSYKDKQTAHNGFFHSELILSDGTRYTTREHMMIDAAGNVVVVEEMIGGSSP